MSAGGRGFATRARFATTVRSGVSVSRRMRRGGLFAPVILLCLVSLVLPACDGGLHTGGPEDDLLPKVLEGLLPKPTLPELTVTCGERSVAGIRTGYSWILKEDSKELDEVWPPPRASGDLLVTSDDSVAFSITFPENSLGVTTAKEAVSAQLSVWDRNAEDSAEEPRPVYSCECEIVELRSGSVSLSWAMPEMMSLHRDGNSFVARLRVTWGDSDSSPWVSFVWNLVAVKKKDLEDVQKTVDAYFDAVWANDESALSAVSPDWLLKGVSDLPPSSLMDDNHGLGRDIIVDPLGILDGQTDAPMGRGLPQLGCFLGDNLLIPIHGQRVKQINAPIFERNPVLGPLLVLLVEEPFAPVLNLKCAEWCFVAFHAR